MTMPNFLIIGAAKSGTSALYEYMKQHPQIYMSPVKEPNFFALEGEKLDFQGPGDQEAIARWSTTSIEAYRMLFQGASNQLAIGEASPLYLYSPKAPHRLRHYAPEMKLIVILRHPVERAYSAFLMMIRDGREPYDSFAQALQEEDSRIRNKWEHIWHYKSMGFYYNQLVRYFEIFDREQISIYLYEDLKKNPIGLLRDVFRFIGVDETFMPDMTSRPNISGLPRSTLLFSLLNRRNPIKTAVRPFLPHGLRKRILTYVDERNLIKPPLPTEVWKHLIEEYRQDIVNLQNLIQRDLSDWVV
jgi:hypothetical protein